jgi:hypothetical protein
LGNHSFNVGLFPNVADYIQDAVASGKCSKAFLGFLYVVRVPARKDKPITCLQKFRSRGESYSARRTGNHDDTIHKSTSSFHKTLYVEG